MRKNRWLYFALGASIVVSIGAVTNQVAPLSTQALALGDQGIIFPDRTVQTTAATLGPDAIPCYCEAFAAKDTKQPFTCWRSDNDSSFSIVPAGQYLLVTDFSAFSSVTGNFLAVLGPDLEGTASVKRPLLDITGSGYPDQVNRSFRAPHVVVAAGERLAMKNTAASAAEVTIYASAFLVPDVAHHL